MKTLRNVLAVLILFATLALSSELLASSAYCEDCSGAEHTCTEKQIQTLNDCFNMFGDTAARYCVQKAKDEYIGCMLLKGCVPQNY